MPGLTATLGMPRQPHELSKSASTSNTSPCQAWNTRIRASTPHHYPQRARAPHRPASVALTRDYKTGPRRRRWYRHQQLQTDRRQHGHSSYAFGVRAGFAALTTEGRYRGTTHDNRTGVSKTPRDRSHGTLVSRVPPPTGLGVAV